MFPIKEESAMPPKCRFTREEVVAAALEIVRTEGAAGVTARAVGARLGASSKVIFSLFENMEELHREILHSADAVYQRFLEEDMTEGKYPPYKASGMAYIRFAKEEKNLFRLLFMRDRSQEQQEEPKELEPLLTLIQRNTGLDREEAGQLHLEMWIFVHGIATMLATGYVELDQETVSDMLTDGYRGIFMRIQEKRGKS
jgi:AcrR family transcriptional regulator